jgi:hypothetical protein
MLNEENFECLDLDDVEHVEHVPLTDSNIHNIKNINPGEYINRDMIPVKKIKCIIPVKLFKNIKCIEKCVNSKFNSAPEFSIYIHGEFDDDGNYVVDEKFYIPKQNVGCASVDYLEEPDSYYNGCLHKHPDACKNFSSTDEKYINSNFDFSLLYVSKNISKGIINLKYHSNYRIQVELSINIKDDEENCDFNIDNINKAHVIPTDNKENLSQTVINTPKLLGNCIMPHVALNDDLQNDLFNPFEFDF